MPDEIVSLPLVDISSAIAEHCTANSLPVQQNAAMQVQVIGGLVSSQQRPL
jgi:hypothetical protein